MRLLFDFISLCLLGLGLILFVLSLVPAMRRRLPIFALTLWAIGLGLAVFVAGLLLFQPAQPPPPPPPPVPQEGNPTV